MGIYAAFHGKLGLNSGASDKDVAEMKALNTIPDNGEYIEFIRFSDGCLLENGISVYPLADLCERNDTYEISEYAPNYLLIGDDSGGKGFLLSMNPEDLAVYSSGLGDMDPRGFRVVGDSFRTWIESML